MIAFIFAPTNEFVAKFPFGHAGQLESELASFLENSGRRLPHGAYLEALGETWTIVSQSPLKLEPGRVASDPPAAASRRAMPAVTTETLPGHRLTGTCGIVSGEAIMEASFFSAIVGGRSAYEENLRKGRAIALAEMSGEAREAGAHAIVGVRFSYGTGTPGSGGIFMISVSGTAVTVEKAPPA